MVSDNGNRLGTYSERVVEALSSLGWTTDRSSPPDEYLTELSSSGFPINETAKVILQSFGGYAFQIPDGGIPWISFTITEARHAFRSDYLPILTTLIDEAEACPVGGGGGYILFACPSGKVALLQEQWFYLTVAESFGDILEAILFNDRKRCRDVPNVEACCPDW